MTSGIRQVSASFSCALALICGCGQGETSPRMERASSSVKSADSLVLTAPSGTEIWFSLARSARSPDGRACTERGLAIQREGRRMQVPLLYTGSAPTLLNDSTLRAMLWINCRPSAAYHVDLRSGRPVPERGRSPSP
jgi:hypothetical protein